MNRRRFLESILKAAAAPAILPAAVAYQRTWVRRETLYLPNLEYVSAPYEVGLMLTDSYFVDQHGKRTFELSNWINTPPDCDIEPPPAHFPPFSLVSDA